MCKKKDSIDRLLDGYGITAKYEGYNDDDDEKGSRTYPARTRIGQERAVGKEGGYLMMPRNFLFWTVPRWLWDWVYSKAYTELLIADDVVTQYNNKNKEGKQKWTNDNVNERVDETMRKWQQIQEKKRGKKISLGNILNGGEIPSKE